MNDRGDESQSQAFGRAAHDLGAEGLLVRSARVRGGFNLVYFPDAVRSPDTIDIVGEEELQRWLKKR